jgi:hypothetical protein
MFGTLLHRFSDAWNLYGLDFFRVGNVWGSISRHWKNREESLFLPVMTGLKGWFFGRYEIIEKKMNEMLAVNTGESYYLPLVFEGRDIYAYSESTC